MAGNKVDSPSSAIHATAKLLQVTSHSGEPRKPAYENVVLAQPSRAGRLRADGPAIANELASPYNVTHIARGNMSRMGADAGGRHAGGMLTERAAMANPSSDNIPPPRRDGNAIDQDGYQVVGSRTASSPSFPTVCVILFLSLVAVGTSIFVAIKPCNQSVDGDSMMEWPGKGFTLKTY